MKAQTCLQVKWEFSGSEEQYWPDVLPDGSSKERIQRQVTVTCSHSNYLRSLNSLLQFRHHSGVNFKCNHLRSSIKVIFNVAHFSFDVSDVPINCWASICLGKRCLYDNVNDSAGGISGKWTNVLWVTKHYHNHSVFINKYRMFTLQLLQFTHTQWFFCSTVYYIFLYLSYFSYLK